MSWFLYLDEIVSVLNSCLAFLTKVEVRAFIALISDSNYWEHAAAITSDMVVNRYCWWDWFLWLFLSFKRKLDLVNYARKHRLDLLSHHSIQLLLEEFHSWERAMLSFLTLICLRRMET